jgi:hypothetical protein
LLAEIAIDRCGYRMRDAADARPQSDDAAEARGVAQASAHIGAVRQPCGAGGERDRAPPEEPAAEREVSQGLRVGPNTSLKVLAPAPNSGVFDLA